MNRNKLKTYAPKARRAFIQAVTARASKFGITASDIEPVQVQGDVALISGQAFPRKFAEQRRKLEERIVLRGFEQVMEEAAYTWFNRFAAIRFMEVHGYLDHGYRVLSHPEGKASPEIIEHAEHIDLAGLDREKVIDLKLDGTKDEELYQMLLTAQCNALHTAMPFLFERIDGETELLLPDNLLHSDSLIRQMVTKIDEADWQEIEIIGWLYQFYISEKKGEVIGKVVRSEDIPAATQLFTPNWVVKYMVQNTLGAKWLATYPKSGIREKMGYFIEPAEQSVEAVNNLADITPKELNPEEITFLDPACGSGHILVEAYDLLKEIYLERGYMLRDIPRLILEKNLFGLDIDERAVQLASFAIIMKARADVRRLFYDCPHPRIHKIYDSITLNPSEIVRALNREKRELVLSSALFPHTITQPLLPQSPPDLEEVGRVISSFRGANVIGSLAQVESSLAQETFRLTGNRAKSLDVFSEAIITGFEKIAVQADLLSRNYDVVVANPPYMSGKYMCETLKRYAEGAFSDCKSDLFSMFIERAFSLAKPNAYVGIMSPFVWMFLKSYERLRIKLISHKSVTSLIHPEYHSFYESAHVPICTFTFINCHVGSTAKFFDLTRERGADLQSPLLKQAIRGAIEGVVHTVNCDSLLAIPGAPFSYWLSDKLRSVYKRGKLLSEVAEPKQGVKTGNNDLFLRLWHEVSLEKCAQALSGRKSVSDKWFPCTKGGDYRRWYGNYEYVLDWEDGGRRLRNYYTPDGRLRSRPQNTQYFFRPGVSWSTITIANFSGRLFPRGFTFESKGSVCFPKKINEYALLAFLNSKVAQEFLSATSPTMDYSEGAVAALPLPGDIPTECEHYAREAVKIAKEDWDSFETSWEFRFHPLVQFGQTKISDCFEQWRADCLERISNLKNFEELSNIAIINTFCLSGDIGPQVRENEVTLERPDAKREVVSLISYAVGCIMGRYSLDEPGLIYANSGDAGFDPARYFTFSADSDGILPVMQTEWLDDEAANRFVEFVKVAWSPNSLSENMKFVADCLGSKSGETPVETVRRYFSTEFFKEHLRVYRKRPIYWLFSSGKEKAFECLVYLHRYNEGTLSRMRMEYVTPLQGRILGRIEQLDRDIQAASTTAAQNKLRKHQEKLKKQQAELIKFDEELRHYADKRIKLDLDDGVKVNYGKFGNLLAEVKTVTGSSDE